MNLQNQLAFGITLLVILFVLASIGIVTINVGDNPSFNKKQEGEISMWLGPAEEMEQCKKILAEREAQEPVKDPIWVPEEASICDDEPRKPLATFGAGFGTATAIMLFLLLLLQYVKRKLKPHQPELEEIKNEFMEKILRR